MAGYGYYLFHQKDHIQKMALGGTALAVGIQLAAIIIQGISMGGLSVHNLVQSLSMAALSVGGMFLYTQYRFNLKILGLFATGLLSVLMLAVVIIPDTAVQPDKVLRGFWFLAHIIFIFAGEATLVMACGAGILYLIQEQGIRGKAPGFFFSRLPSLDFLDTVSYTCITTGFALLTFGLVTGFIYAKAVWGSFWGWDVKEIFSVGTWLVYATLLHLRFYSGWQGRRSAMMSIVGFAMLAFTFLGVNLLFGGHHQAFTR
ncbi:MAG: c-type cytochrome biogenesis protein CcsB [Desulfobacterales bacterium]|nr:MAG: c-type cytochrome biogenesis protein CcsB [Desulfobacterales bacterium]